MTLITERVGIKAAVHIRNPDNQRLFCKDFTVENCNEECG